MMAEKSAQSPGVELGMTTPLGTATNEANKENTEIGLACSAQAVASDCGAIRASRPSSGIVCPAVGRAARARGKRIVQPGLQFSLGGSRTLALRA